MPLSKGDRLGPYEILALVGQGGMGEVYRAHDDRLRRDVAIKVSNAQFTERFTLEARAIAALNHTNIAHLYDVGQNYLVMEYVEGEDLKGPLDFDDALPIIQQLIDGIEAAHEKNIVHRDLKPANIKITPEGVVKILDFGLAKAMDPSPPGSGSPGNSPTLTMGATAAGTILGTAAYMAPEQAKGKQADKRSDIWSFGVILYEVFTGKKLFTGETAVEILGGVLNKEPDITAAPARVHKLLHWCLESDRKQRLQAIGDARRLLSERGTEVALQTESRHQSNLPWIVAGVFALIAALVTAAAGFGWRRGGQTVEQPMVRLDVDLGSDISLATPTGSSTVILSPDGTRLVYLASVAGGDGFPRLFIRRLDQPKSAELPGTSGAYSPFFSPDSQWVGYTVGQKLYKIPVDGGAAAPIGDSGSSTGSSWGEDGNIAATVLLKGMLRIPAAGGVTVPALDLVNGEFTFLAPQILPGGKTILYSVYPGGRNDPDQARVETAAFADKIRKIVAQGATSPRYLADTNKSGYLIYANRSTLFAAAFNLNNPEKSGKAVPVLDDVRFHPGTFESQFDVSPTGNLVYRKAGAGSAYALTTIEWVDAAGKRQPLVSKAGGYQTARLSPEGKRLAVAVMGGGGQVQDIEIYDLQRETWTLLTADSRASFSPVWNVDGQSIVFGTLTGAYWTRADGASQPQPLLSTQSIQAPSSIAPDGKRLVYSDGNGNAAQLWSMSLENTGGHLKAGTPEQFLKSVGTEDNPVFSPDGKWLAYVSNSSGVAEVYVRAFPDSGGLWKISNSGGQNPIWSRNGHDLLYQAGDQEMAVTYSAKNGTFAPEKPRVWMAKVGGIANDLSIDGKLLLVLARVDSPGAARAEHEVVLFQNFREYLRQKIPTDK